MIGPRSQREACAERCFAGAWELCDELDETEGTRAADRLDRLVLTGRVRCGGVDGGVGACTFRQWTGVWAVACRQWHVGSGEQVVGVRVGVRASVFSCLFGV